MDPGHRPGRQADGDASRASIRNVAYALLSGADGWMFDGEDALGQVVDDVARQPAQPQAGDRIATRCFLQRRRSRSPREMNPWAQGFLGRPIVDDWRRQLDFTTKIFRAARPAPRRSPRAATRTAPASPPRSSTLALYVVNNHRRLRESGASIVLYLPKIQTAEEAALWNDMLAALERHLGLPLGTHQGLRAGRADRGVLSS